MQKDSSYQALAREFMDLWQKQLSTVISDKQFIQAMLEMFQSTPGSNDRTRTADPADAAHASDADHGLLAELAFRLAMCEKRLAALEHGKTKRKPAAKPVRKSPRRGSKKPRK